MSEERAPYVTRITDLAQEIIQETDLEPGKAMALELARLQTERADLHEYNAELRQMLEDTRCWAKAWKRAAKVNRRAISDFAQFGPRCPKCLTRSLIPKKTICQCAQCNAEVHIDDDVQVAEPNVGEPCPTCGHLLPHAKVG